MNRRGFLAGILAAGVAPYVVTTAGVLMPVKQRVWLRPIESFTWSGPLRPPLTATEVRAQQARYERMWAEARTRAVSPEIERFAAALLPFLTRDVPPFRG